MNPKAGIVLSIVSIVLILLVWGGITAAGVASELSSVHTILEDAKTKHSTQAELTQKLKSMGYTLSDTPTESTGSGPNHTMLFLNTHLTVSLKFDADGKNTGYHLDRA